MKNYNDPEIQILLCDYIKNLESWNHENVFNSCWVFYWNDIPGAMLKSGKSKYALKPEEFCLIAPETVFSTSEESPFNHFFIHFRIGTPFDQIKSKIYFFPINDFVIGQIEMIKSIITGRVPNPTHLSLLAHSLVCCLFLNVDENGLKSLKSCDSRIVTALGFLNRKLSSIVSNEELAESAGMSVNGFIRLFQKELGFTPQKYHRRKRIEKASVLLHFSDKKIDEIAMETGFLDRYHFSKAFKETTSYSPAEFRKRRISL